MKEEYVGEFRNNKKNGKGVYTFSNGEKYKGQFKDNQRNGKGILEYIDGSIV